MEKHPLVPELYCSSFAASRAFYTKVLGFCVLYEREEEGFAYMEREGAQLLIDELSDGPRSWIPAPLEKPYGRGMNLQIWTQNVDALYAQVQAHQAVIFLPMEERWYRRNDVFVGNRQFIVQDPDGYLLRFAQDLGMRAP
jgi:catechol 2,3-dioxygenase-like lactoylglutathione lyase family enzyme